MGRHLPTFLQTTWQFSGGDGAASAFPPHLKSGLFKDIEKPEPGVLRVAWSTAEALWSRCASVPPAEGKALHHGQEHWDAAPRHSTLGTGCQTVLTLSSSAAGREPADGGEERGQPCHLWSVPGRAVQRARDPTPRDRRGAACPFLLLLGNASGK